ncbi:MAG: cytochrome c [Alphaproteobacteria bacterium]|nr:cytochrome c [Alphaproteobacteria bacterium]
MRLAFPALAVAVVLAAAGGALAQAPPAKDTIFARKILMGKIDMTMDEIETMLAPGGTLDLAEAQEHADLISVMLMAFPHMFAPDTNQWRPVDPDRDPATDTYAAPEVWSNFDDFYQRARAASTLAFEASRAKRAAFRPLVAQLRAACNGCHAAYQKTD